jgi:general stress protein YciG
MKCPQCSYEIPDKKIAKHLAAKGGSKTGPTKARDPEKMRAAVMKRWKNAKLGGRPRMKNK